MIWICPKQFPPKLLNKLHTRSAGPFKILNKLNDNTYIIDLPKDFGITYTFNIENLVDYKGLDFNPNNPLANNSSPEPFSESPHYPHFQILILIRQMELIKF